MDALVVAGQRRRRGQPHAAARAAGGGRLRGRRDLPHLRREGMGGPLRPVPLPAMGGAPRPRDPRGPAPRPGRRPHDGHRLAVRGTVGRRRGRSSSLVLKRDGRGADVAVAQARSRRSSAPRPAERARCSTRTRSRPSSGTSRGSTRPSGLPRRAAARPVPRLVRVLRGELDAEPLDRVPGAPRLRPAGRPAGPLRRRPAGRRRARAERLPRDALRPPPRVRPPLDRLDPRPGQPRPQPGARRAGRPPRCLRRGGHPRDRGLPPPDEAQIPRLKLASSAAHVAGRTLASAEAFTWLGEHFQTPLAQAKEAADWLLLSGVNHLVYHGVPYSPAGAAWPGWQFYASVNFGPQGGLWRDLPELNGYLARVQAVLQAGEPDEDVLLYYSPRDAWHAAGELILPNPVPPAFEEAGLLLWKRGFAWDAVSDAGSPRPASRRGGCASAPAAIGRSSSRASGS